MDQIDPIADHPHLRTSPNLREWGAIFLIAILTAWVVYSPSSGHMRWQQVLHNSGHGPIFGCVAILLLIAARTHRSFRHWSLARQCACAIAGSAFLGLSAEGLQFFTHRDPSWMDATNDAAGAIAFVSAFAWYETGFQSRERATWLRAVLLIVVFAASAFLLEPAFAAARAYVLRTTQFPVLADFTGGTGDFFIEPQYSTLTSIRLPQALAHTPGEQSLEVLFDAGPYPGMLLQEPIKDWSRYSTLVLDLANPTQEPLNVVMRIDDQHRHRLFGDRFNRDLFVDANARVEIRIPMQDIQHGPRQRLLDLSRIARLFLFCRATCGADRMDVQKIWLE